MSLNESIFEDATLEWFGELGYAVGHGPHLAPGEPAAERDSFGEVLLVGRLREAIRRLNPAIPEEAREEALRNVLRVGRLRELRRLIVDLLDARQPSSAV
jgi:type I restriction enzyme, R subunit